MATAAENQLDVLLQAMEEVVEQPEDLEGCEKLIEGSSLKNNFLRIGQALVTINDRQLYKRDGCTSFTQYIEQKGDFGFGPRQALRLVAATRLVRNFPPTIALPTSERQVRALVGMDQQQAIKVWVKANLIATETGVPLTHRLVESVLGKERPPGRGAASAATPGGSGNGSARELGEGAEPAEAPSSGRKRPAGSNSVLQDYVAPDSDEFVTPTYIVQAVRKLYGGTIDLDPCSTSAANAVVQATRTFTGVEAGLAPENKWSGKIFVHPPSSSADAGDTIPGRFLARAVTEASPSSSSGPSSSSSSATEVVLLLRCAVGQPWFSRVYELPHCWLSERGPQRKAAAPFGSCVDSSKSPRGMLVAYVGKRVKEFCAAFNDLGHIPGTTSWTGTKYR